MSCNNCKKSSYISETCPDVLPTSCISTQIADNECLGTCKGESLSSFLSKISDILCHVKKEVDLSQQVVPNCLSQDFLFSENDKDVKGFINFLLTTSCNLKSQIDELTQIIPNLGDSIQVNVDVKCLTQNPCGAPNTSLTSILQAIIDILCEVYTGTIPFIAVSIADLQTKNNSLQTQVTSLNNSVASLITLTTQLNSRVNALENP